MGVWVSVQAFLEAQWCKRLKVRAEEIPGFISAEGSNQVTESQVQQLLCPVTHEDEGSFAGSQLQAFGWFARRELSADACELLSAELCEYSTWVAFDQFWFYPLPLYHHHHRQ